MMQVASLYDVLIIGGGPAGLHGSPLFGTGPLSRPGP